MNKKLIAVAAAGTLLVALAAVQFPLRARADNDDDDNGKGKMMKVEKAENHFEKMKEVMERVADENVLGDRESVQIKPNGNFRITGATVTGVDVGGQTITGTLFSFTRTVSVASGTKITGGGGTMTLADIVVGDKLAASGNFNASTHAITVTEIRDVSAKNRQNVTAIQKRIDELLKLIEDLKAKLKALSGT